ncbi:ClpP-like prohead protease/major capsid protein fusion protein [Sphingomonas paucimobilis]|uniref:ClpP-like prohead protease/major capsid protein fusion protein n=1 Tax=Sphingomonas paucimobilis TaxID=13689 RepID=UPI00203ADD41|nr:ClpP-like prohead protease/major capsid protein fusion protein [Sphingomonas paucimobilis]MCM3679471.1 ATP-dependent Clp protease proteolytic subunit [Sphingomonas paucimobilis]
MAEILIYGIVGDSWDGLDANTLVPLISEGDDDLDIRINSPGGYVMEGLAIYNAIVREKKKGRKVTTHIDGLAASMGSVLAMAGESIMMADNALVMIHNPWDCACGDANELRRAADKLDRLRDQIVGIYSGQTGLSADDLIPMLDEETWFTAAQALEQNFITEIVGASTASASNVQPFGFKHAPDSPLITAMAMARAPRTAAADPKRPQENSMDLYKTRAALVAAIAKFQQEGGGQDEIKKITASAIALDAKDALPATGPLALSGGQPAVENGPAALTNADVTNAVAAERSRVGTIRALGAKHNLAADFVDGLITDGTPLASAREKILDKLAEQGDAANIGHNSPARVTVDQRDKFREGATNWLLVKAGVAHLVEKAAALKGETVKIDPGEFRGVRNVDLARESLANLGVNVTTRDPDLIVRQAMTSQGAVITQTTSDFPVLFENAIHRVLQAAYATTPDTWTRFCGTGTVVDFRDHSRYLRGSFGALDNVNEAGEFKNKPIPDLAKEKIRATTKGNIINLSRQAIVNDDMEVFSGLAVDLGRAAKLTIEIDVYALLNSNPLMNDGVPLFDNAHGNLASSGTPPTVVAFDAIRVAMASQKDISGAEFLDIRPAIGLFPIGLGGSARIVNGSQYDPDSVNKLQRPNIVNGMLEDIVDTPRLTGSAYYLFADPNIAPAIEVVFLNGVTEPFTDSQDGWRVDGVEWKVRHDYGVGAVNYRSAYKQPGA